MLNHFTIEKISGRKFAIRHNATGKTLGGRVHGKRLAVAIAGELERISSEKIGSADVSEVVAALPEGSGSYVSEIGTAPAFKTYTDWRKF